MKRLLLITFLMALGFSTLSLAANQATPRSPDCTGQ
jgi:hypothetical protein